MFRYKGTELRNSATTKAKFCESCSSTVLNKKNQIWFENVAEKNFSKVYEGIQVYVRTRQMIMDSPDFAEVNYYIMSLWIMTSCSLVAR